MDISNISAMYQNYNQTAAGSATGNQISQLQGKDMSQATDEELMDACKEFEAYFMEQVMKEMIKTTNWMERMNLPIQWSIISRTLRSLIWQRNRQSRIAWGLHRCCMSR